MSKFSQFWAKIKSIKHIHIILPVVIGLVLCAICFGGSLVFSDDKQEQDSTQESSSTLEYVQELENKLCNVLSKISGVGSCDVLITLESGFKYEYATDTETKTSISGDTQTSITTETVILVSNEPVVVREIYPVVKGVVVVADGAQNISTKLNILAAIETVLEIDSEKITILS